VKKYERLTKYELMGMSALIPGLVSAREAIDAEIRRYQGIIALARENEEGGEPEPEAKTGRGSHQAAYWARMTPEERSAEMRRRGMVNKKKKLAQAGELTKRGVPAKMHPRDPRHPGHDAWIVKIRKANKQSWTKLTPEQHAARAAAVNKGRAA